MTAPLSARSLIYLVESRRRSKLPRQITDQSAIESLAEILSAAQQKSAG